MRDQGAQKPQPERLPVGAIASLVGGTPPLVELLDLRRTGASMALTTGTGD